MDQEATTELIPQTESTHAVVSTSDTVSHDEEQAKTPTTPRVPLDHEDLTTSEDLTSPEGMERGDDFKDTKQSGNPTFNPTDLPQSTPMESQWNRSFEKFQ